MSVPSAPAAISLVGPIPARQARRTRIAGRIPARRR
jgi:hypothetical protein